MSMDKIWSKEEVATHLRTNLTEKAGSYSAAVVVAALYKKLYGEFPKIGLSGAQAECADSIIPLLPETLEKEFDHKSIDAVVWAKEFMRLYNKNKLRPINVADWVDESLMIAWFANSIMAGFDEASRRKQPALDKTEKETRETCKCVPPDPCSCHPDCNTCLTCYGKLPKPSPAKVPNTVKHDSDTTELVTDIRVALNDVIKFLKAHSVAETK